MKISYRWLQSFLPTDLSPEVVAEYLTSTGLEVEGMEKWESIRGGLRKVVTGCVVECQPHPDADKLKVCKVDTGEEALLNIVCGAPNVAEGQKVPVALMGAVLFPFGKEDGFEIGKSKIRGVVSEGMICAEDELGIGTSHDGIMVLDPETPVGIPVAGLLGVETDVVFEIGLTPNRTDAMSHFGVARDLAACIIFRNNTNIALKDPEYLLSGSVKSALPSSVVIENHSGCRRYSAVVLDHVVIAESPEWLKNRLKAIGIKPHNNVVDLTNYVLHEYGHPLHAFDYDKIHGGAVVVKNLPEGTPFTTLDGVERKLKGGDLMICDTEKPLCIAGVYGGMGSGVTTETSRVFLESAWFDPVSVRLTAKHHNLSTDASFRFERGADPSITLKALSRVAGLICEVTGASVASAIIDVGDFKEIVTPKRVKLGFLRVDLLFGQHIDRDELLAILKVLSFEVISEEDDGLHLSIPLFRYDVTREIDVIEEVMRIYGMNNIEIPSKVAVSFQNQCSSDEEGRRETVSSYLIAHGFYEAWNNSITSSAYGSLVPLSDITEKTVPLINPLSTELDEMRHTLLFGLMENASHNLNRKWDRIRLFELGVEYTQKRDALLDAAVLKRFSENKVLALLMVGFDNVESWFDHRKQVVFFDIRQYIEGLLMLAGINPVECATEEYSDSSMEKGLRWKLGDKTLAEAGFIHQKIRKYFGVKVPVLYAEVQWLLLCSMATKMQMKVQPLPRFPDVRRDLSLVIDKSVKFELLRKDVISVEKKLIRDVVLFDVYEGENLPEGKKSYAIGIVLRDMEKTLSDKEIDRVMRKVIERLEKTCGATLRQ